MPPRSRPASSRIRGGPLLVLDQFEEFFQGTNAPSRDAFEVELADRSDLARDIHVAVSIRDDAPTGSTR